MSARDIAPRVLLLVTGGGLMAWLGACQDLPTITRGECGNHVLEPDSGEDCDGSAAVYGPSARCGAPDTAAACRLTCSVQGGADAPQCPAGWGCGSDGICRQPTAQFEFDSLPGLARGVGDLDGDGLTDVVMRGSQGELEVAFFTESRNLAEVFVDPGRRPLSDEPRIEPFIGRLSNDGVDDIALPLVSDEVSVRVFMGAADRSPNDPFVELITVPFEGEIDMLEVFNPWGVPAGLCASGGCRESLLLSKRDANKTLYAVLDERELVELFELELGRRQQSWAVERWDQSRSCDLLAVSYRYLDTGSPDNTIDLFPLCAGDDTFNTDNTPISTVSVGELDAQLSLRIASTADIDGNGWPDLLINATDNDPTTTDEPRGYVLWGTGDGHFNREVDFSGAVDVADRFEPLLQWVTWVAPDDPAALDHGTWPQAAEDINGDGRADFLLSAGIVVLSSDDPNQVCTLGNEVLIAGPAVGEDGPPQWGYTCVVITEEGLVPGSETSREDVVRDYWSSDSLARAVDLNGDGQLEFAGISKGKSGNAGQQVDHTPTDYLDLIWLDPSNHQLVLQTLTAERFEDVGAGDIDGDFEADLVFDNGKSLQVIRGAPFELSRASRVSPVGFDGLEVFGEGRPSASVGAVRDGRLTILRDGEWPAIALTNEDSCDEAKDCHIRFASGALAGGTGYFAWALAVIQTSDSGGLRLLRAIEGEANLGPAYDSIAAPLVGLGAVGISAEASSARVLPIELGGEAGTEEVLIVARTDESVELAILRPYLETEPASDLCGPSFTVTLDDGVFDQQAVCFEWLETLSVPTTARTTDPTRNVDPFVEVADADGDGHLDVSWVTFDNSIVLVYGDGSGSLPLTYVEMFLPEEEEDEAPEPGELGQPARIDWFRWIELDGGPGRELVTGDLLGSQTLWGIYANFADSLDPRGAIELDGIGSRPGFPGDFDGDGVDDVAIGTVMMFGKPIND